MVLLSTCIARKWYYKRASGSLVAASRDQSYREITCIAFGTLPFGTDTVTHSVSKICIFCNFGLGSDVKGSRFWYSKILTCKHTRRLLSAFVVISLG